MTSSIVDRVMRSNEAVLLEAVAMAGRIKFFHPVTPIAGNQRIFSENPSTSIMASQNVGIEVSSSAQPSAKLSDREYCLTAEKTPIGKPIVTAMIVLTTASTNV